MKLTHNSEALLFLKIAGVWGFTNSAGTPETETRADFIKLHLCTKSRYWRLNTHLCNHAWDLSLECEISTTLEPFREKTTICKTYLS